jgi:hypothetical protein
VGAARVLLAQEIVGARIDDHAVERSVLRSQDPAKEQRSGILRGIIRNKIRWRNVQADQVLRQIQSVLAVNRPAQNKRYENCLHYKLHSNGDSTVDTRKRLTGRLAKELQDNQMQKAVPIYSGLGPQRLRHSRGHMGIMIDRPATELQLQKFSGIVVANSHRRG